MKLIYKKSYFALVFILLSFLAINFCFAAGFLKDDVKAKIGNQVEKSAAGYDTTNVNNIYGLVQTVINASLGVIGVLLLVYILYAGYNWLTAQGDEEKVTKAKDTIQRAIIGVIIILAAYAISIFVVGRLQQGTLNNSSSVQQQTTP